MSKNFQVLDWWNRHQNLFLVLSIIVKELLTSHVSTVTVEQTFIIGDNILEARQSLLHLSTLEATSCVDDWTRADPRQQEYAPITLKTCSTMHLQVQAERELKDQQSLIMMMIDQ